MSKNKGAIGSNAVEIAVSILPLYPAGVVESFATDSDVWAPDDVETADAVKTVDGYVYKWGKNTMKGGTLTLAPYSAIRKFLNIALLAQERNGPEVAEPFTVNMTITHKHAGWRSVYADGVIASGGVDEQIGSERLADRSYTLRFGTLIKKDI